MSEWPSPPNNETQDIYSKDLFLGNTRSRNKISIPGELWPTVELLVQEVIKVKQIYKHWSETESAAVEEINTILEGRSRSMPDSKTENSSQDATVHLHTPSELYKLRTLQQYVRACQAAYLSYHENVMSLLDSQLIGSDFNYTNRNKLKYIQKMINDLIRMVEVVYQYLAYKYPSTKLEFEPVLIVLMTLQEISLKCTSLNQLYELPPSQLHVYHRKRVQAPREQSELDKMSNHPIKRL